MHKIILALFLTLLATWVAVAQQRSQPKELSGYLVVAVCGTLPAPAYVAGTYAAPTIDVAGETCVNK
jgi:hypothetical protein